MALRILVLFAFFSALYSSFVSAMHAHPEVKEGPNNCFWSEEKLPTAEDIESILVVHATDTFPEGGVVKARIAALRPTLHFALGALVSPHTDPDTGEVTSWNQMRYAVITSLRSLAPQLVNINPYDTFILGDFKFDATTILLVPEGTDTSSLQDAGIQIETYTIEDETSLRKAVDRVIQSQGGCSVKMQNMTKGSAMVGHVNINHPDYFQAFIDKYKKLQISYGYHSTSLQGDAYRFGLLGSVLSYLGEQAQAQKKLGDSAIDTTSSIFGALLIINAMHTLAALLESVDSRPYPPSSKKKLLDSAKFMKALFMKILQGIARPATLSQITVDLILGCHEVFENMSPSDFKGFLQNLIQYGAVLTPEQVESMIQMKTQMEHKNRIYADRDHLLKFGLAGNERILKRYLSQLFKKNLAAQNFELLKILYAADTNNHIELINAILRNDNLLRFFIQDGKDIKAPFVMEDVSPALQSAVDNRPWEYRDLMGASASVIELKSHRDHLIQVGLGESEGILEAYLASFFKEDLASQKDEFIKIVGEHNGDYAYRPELLGELFKNEALREYLKEQSPADFAAVLNMVRIKAQMDHKTRIYADQNHLLTFGLAGNEKTLKKFLAKFSKKSLTAQKFEILKILFVAGNENDFDLLNAMLRDEILLNSLQKDGLAIQTPLLKKDGFPAMVSFEKNRPRREWHFLAQAANTNYEKQTDRDHLTQFGLSESDGILEHYLENFFAQDLPSQKAEFMEIREIGSIAYVPELLEVLLKDEARRGYLKQQGVLDNFSANDPKH